jgi:hypothetical protein
MSGKYSLNTFGNIIKYDYIRSNVGIGVNPDIFARLKVNSISTGEDNNLWVAGLFGGVNDSLNKVAIGTINSNAVIGSIDTQYNWKNLYLNSDTKNTYGDVYMLGNVINSNNVYINSNLNIQYGNVGIGKYSTNIRLDVNGTGTGNDNVNWITASIGSANNNLNRIVIGTLNSNASLSSYNIKNNTWTPLILNGDGNGNGCNVLVDTNLLVNSNLLVYYGNLCVNLGSNSYSNAIVIGNINGASTIYSSNNFTGLYNDLYLNCDSSNNGADVRIQKNLHIASNLSVHNDIYSYHHININDYYFKNSNVALYVNSSNNWITATFGSSNYYDNRAVIGVKSSNVIFGSMNSNMTHWTPLYLNGDSITGYGNDVYVVNSLNIYSNLNIYGGIVGIGTNKAYDNLHIYSNVSGDIGITIENINTYPSKQSVSSIKLKNDTSNNFIMYLNSSKGSIFNDDYTSNSTVFFNKGGELIFKTLNNNGLKIDNSGTGIFNSNLYVYSNLNIGGIGINGINSNTVSIFGDIALYNKLTSNYHYNIYSDQLQSNLTWVLPNRYPNNRELFTHNSLTGKLDWINIADFNVDYWNIGYSNQTGYLSIAETSNFIFPNNFKVGYKSSNITIGNYIYRKYPKNTYVDSNISFDFTDSFNISFSATEQQTANNYRMYIKYDTATYGFNFIRSGLITKEYLFNTSNYVSKSVNAIQNYFNNNNYISYNIINSLNSFNYISNTRKALELSFLFIPTASTKFAFTLASRYFYGSINIDTINTSDGTFTSTNPASYPLLFDYSGETNNSIPKVLTPNTHTVVDADTFTAGQVYRVIIRILHYTNNESIQVYFTNTDANLTQNNIFTNTTAIYYKLTNSKYVINYNNYDYTNGTQIYKIDNLLVNDLANNYYYTNKYLTDTSNILNNNSISSWYSDKIFKANGDIDNTITYTAIRDNNIGNYPTGAFDISGFVKTGTSYSLADIIYNPISQGSLYGTTIIYSMSANIKLVTYGISISADIKSAPSKWRLYGSTTGQTNTISTNYWDLLDDRTSAYFTNYTANSITYFKPNNIDKGLFYNKYYKYFAIVVSSIVGSTNNLSINSLVFNGIDDTYFVDNKQNVSDPSYFNDVLSLTYFGDVGIGTNDPKYKLDVKGSVNLLNLHTEGSINVDNNIIINKTSYSSNSFVYGKLEVSDSIFANNIWGELHGNAYLYNPTIYNDTNAYGNIYVNSNVGIGTIAHSRKRLDIDALGTGLNTADWVAARFGGTTSANNLVVGTINNFAAVGGYNNNDNWVPLLLNGDNVGNGNDVITSSNLIVSCNLYVNRDISILSNLYVGSNVGIGRQPSNIRLDVNAYGTGLDANNWIAARFGGTQSTNRFSVGAINDYATMGAVTENFQWTTLLLNGDNKGNGGDVIIANNLFTGSNISLNSNLFIGSNVGIGKRPTNFRLDVDAYGTGLNNVSWVAGRFGGSQSTQKVVIGTINNNSTIASFDANNNWSELLLNGDGIGNGSKVITAGDLKVNSNLYVSSNIFITSNVYIGSNVGIGKFPTNFRLDVNSYGTGNDAVSWVASRFGGSVNNNRIVLGTINTYPTIGAYDNNNNWTNLLINGDYAGNGGDVYIEKNLTVKNGMTINNNLQIYGNFIVGAATTSTNKVVTIYGNISTVGADANNGIITATNGFIATGGGASITGPLVITSGGTSSLTANTYNLSATNVNITGITKQTGTLEITALTTIDNGGLTILNTGGARIDGPVVITTGGTSSITATNFNITASTLNTGTLEITALTTINNGGITILNAGGARIDGSVVITTGGTSSFTGTTLNATATNINLTGSTLNTGTLQVTALTTINNAGLTILNAGGARIDGPTVITSGGTSSLTATTYNLSATNVNITGITKQTGTLEITALTTIDNDGLTILNTGGARIDGPVVITTGGTSSITATNFNITASTLNTGTLQITALTTINNGGLTILNAGGARIDGALVITSGGSSSFTGTSYSVTATNINLTGSTLNTGTLQVTALTTINNAGLTILNAGGARIDGPTVITSGGISSLTATTYNLAATNVNITGITKQTGTLQITALTTIDNGGITISNAGGARIDGPVVITTGGTSSFTGTTLNATATNINLTGSTLNTGTLQITALTTINNAGLTILNAGGARIDGAVVITTGGTSSFTGTTLNVTATTTNITSITNITGATTITGNTSIIGNITQTDNTKLISLAGDIELGNAGSYLTDGGTITIGNNTNKSKSLSVYGNIYLYGNDASNGKVFAPGGITMTTGDITLQAGNLYLTGASGSITAYGNQTLGNGTGAGSVLTVYGNVNIAGTGASNGKLSVENGITVSAGGINITGTFTSSGSANTLVSSTTNGITGVTNNITASTANNLSGPFYVYGASSFSSTVSTNGAITVTTGGVDITGNSLFKGTVGINNLLTISNNGGATITGPVNITGATQITGNFTTVSAVNTLGGDTVVGGKLTLNGLTTFNSAVTIASGGLTIQSSGGATISGNVDISGTTRSASTLTVTAGGATISSGNVLVSSGNLTLASGNLSVTGTGSTSGTFTSGGLLTVLSGGANITGTTTLSSTLTVSGGGASISGNTSIVGGGTLSVAGTTTSGGKLTVSSGGATITGNTDITGTTTSSSTLIVSAGGATITGATSVIGNTSITGTTTSSSTLTVSGGGASITGNTSIVGGGTLTVAGATTSGGILTVSSGGASITGSVSILGTTSMNNTLTISAGGAAITGNVSISGTTTMGGLLTISSGGANITGTTAVTGALTVSSTATISGTTTSTGMIYANGGLTLGTGGLTIPGTLVVGSGNTVTLSNGTIISTGTATIGGAATLNNNLSVAGNATISGSASVGPYTGSHQLGVGGSVVAAAFMVSSDRRLKKNIKIIENSIDIIDKLEGVYYDRIDNDKSCIGLIAQDVEKILPQVVNTDSDINNYKSIEYQNIIALLVEGIKELNNKYNNLLIKNNLRE